LKYDMYQKLKWLIWRLYLLCLIVYVEWNWV
jgi:hypothetical protein